MYDYIWKNLKKFWKISIFDLTPFQQTRSILILKMFFEFLNCFFENFEKIKVGMYAFDFQIKLVMMVYIEAWFEIWPKKGDFLEKWSEKSVFSQFINYRGV